MSSALSSGIRGEHNTHCKPTASSAGCSSFKGTTFVVKRSGLSRGDHSGRGFIETRLDSAMGTTFRRTIGLPGATFTLIGLVIGASIFILPGELAARTGPGLVVAYLLAAVPALLACFVSAQIGSAFPVSGATYVAVSRLLTPLWGFMVVWVILVSIAVGVALVAYGFVDYLAFFIPNLHRTILALGVVSIFTVLNIFGAKTSVRVQAVMVGWIVLALILFGVVGMLNVQWPRMTPLFPAGLFPVAVAAVPAYFSYIGFLVIVDLGGEIERPARTIPLALAISFCTVLLLYMLVAVALPGLIPWTDLGTTTAPIATAAATFLPKPLAAAISLGALAAAATTLNGILLGQSRDVYALACDRIFPVALAQLHPRFLTPHRAILMVGLASVIGVISGATITQYATMAVLGFMIVQILAAGAVYVLPTRDYDRYLRAEFKLNPIGRVVASVGLGVYSVAFLLLAAVQSPRAAGTFIALLFLGVVYFEWRRRLMKRGGIDLNEALRKDLGLPDA